MPDFYKHWRPTRPGQADAHLAERVDELRSAIQHLDPEQAAARSGATYLTQGHGRGELHVPLWGQECILTWPELTGSNSRAEPLSDFHLALLFYYLLTADGTSRTGRWVSFADLPNGRTYSTAFQGYSGDEVVKAFGMNRDAFRQVCISAGGMEENLASASFTFLPLPRVPLMITYWLGDEDFPSSCKILFDGSASHYLPIDACAILGSMLAAKLIRSKRTS